MTLLPLFCGAAEGDVGASGATSVTLRTTVEGRALLERVEKRFQGVRTIQVRFAQVRLQPDFDDETRSSGYLTVQMPDRLRCEYDRPDPSVIMFVDDTFYQYTPTLKQVDMTRFASSEEAQRHLRMMLLGFGLSTAEVLESYAVDVVDKDSPGLVFHPRRADVSRTFEEFRVWFDSKDLTPRKVRIVETGGDVVTLSVESLKTNKPVKPDLFKADFPQDVEVIDHTSVAPEADVKERNVP